KSPYFTILRCRKSASGPEQPCLWRPRDHLRQIGIPVKVDLPVGKNLQDHPATILGPILIDPPKSFIPDRDLTLSNY
ncbi:unnamed protein product, partial [Allacma fusca]